MPVYDRDSWWREWRQTALPVAVTLALLALGLANVVSRATSAEVTLLPGTVDSAKMF